MRIVFLGNFDFPFSTESHHAWTWEKMGHTVVKMQENRTSTNHVVDACHGADLFQYTHTHGWNTPGTFGLEEMLHRIRKIGVKSFSYHLDLYWGLNTLDKREDRIGQHPSWKVDYFFSTDGANQQKYLDRGVNHIYLPPGVVEYGCKKGQFQQVLSSEIGFVGSVGYHPEYPFRTKMIEELRKMYGPQFRVYGGFREEALNNVYASCKIIVGDHCMAGMPYYWSDRLPESGGRGAFIVYPMTLGLEEYVTHGLATYEPQNMNSLYNQIAYFMNHPQERDERRDRLQEYIKNNHTYTHRLKKILEIMGYNS